MILDGKALSLKVLENVKKQVSNLPVKPHLVVILVGNDAASEIYVKNKKLAAEKVGIKSTIIKYDSDIKERDLLNKISELNATDDITGILVQMPLPKHINKNNIIQAISPKKDVDGFTPENVGKLAIGIEPYFYPATPQGIIMLLDEYNIPIQGANAVIIGRSNIVGKPVAQMLLQRNATVTIAHSYTKSLENIIKTADIVISAVGKKVVRCKMVYEISTLIDVGIFKDSNGKFTGDVEFDEIKNSVKYISPVPGGVGPMTIASLMYNASKIYK